MFNCAAVQHIIHCKCDAESFIYSTCLPDMLDSVSYISNHVCSQTLGTARPIVCTICNVRIAFTVERRPLHVWGYL